MKAERIFETVDEIAPFSVHASFDNPGFLVGDKNAEIEKVIVSLDITPEVINEAKEKNAQMIISHHPVIFRPLKKLMSSDPVFDLVQNNMCAICAHTNLDCAKGGVNDILIRLAGVEGNTEILFDEESLPLGRIGTLSQEIELETYVSFIKKQLNANVVRYVDGGKKVKKIAVIGGAGADEMFSAIEKGVDTFVTGDTKYHNMLDAKRLGLNLIDAGHFATENPVVDMLVKTLSEKIKGVKFEASSIHADVIKVM